MNKSKKMVKKKNKNKTIKKQKAGAPNRKYRLQEFYWQYQR